MFNRQRQEDIAEIEFMSKISVNKFKIWSKCFILNVLKIKEITDFGGKDNDHGVLSRQRIILASVSTSIAREIRKSILKWWIQTVKKTAHNNDYNQAKGFRV